MSFFKSAAAVVGIGSSIWGAKEDKDSRKDAINAQQDQNAANRDFIREQSENARRDVIPLFETANENRQLGTEAALKTLWNGMHEQSNLYRGGNVAAQDALLAGLPQIQNAILGNPVDMSALQSTRLPNNSGFMSRSFRVPEFKDPIAAMERYRTEKEAEDSLEQYSPLSGATPGTTTNREVVDLLYNSGQLSETDYGRMQTTFKNAPNVANSKWWMQAGSHDRLTQGLNDDPNLSPDYRGTLERLYGSIYQSPPQAQRQAPTDIASLLGTSPYKNRPYSGGISTMLGGNFGWR